MDQDKKKGARGLRLIVLHDIGQAAIIDDPGREALLKAWRAVLR